jgi:hypothetical protein
VVAQHFNTAGNFWFSFLAFASVGLDTAYPELDLDSYLNQAGRDMLALAATPAWSTACCWAWAGTSRTSRRPTR